MSDSEQSIGDTISENVVADLEAKEPPEDEQQRLREEHEGHLVRDTTSDLSMEVAVAEGFAPEVTAEVPDMYCFTCEEWVGLSGIGLRGTPRSKKEAFYLGGMPTDVLHAKQGTAKTLNELADALIERVAAIEDREDAFEFIEAELEVLE